MKRYLSFILVAIVLVMTFALASCNEDAPAPTPDSGEHVHTPGEWVLVASPSCIYHGEKIQFCTECKELLHRMPVYEAGWSHVEIVTIEGVEVTCDEIGYTPETRCSVCEAVVQHRTEIPALGCEAGSWETILEPTCAEKGTEVKKCIRCEKVMEERDIDALEHTAGEWETTLEPTCTETGTKVQNCTVCGEPANTEELPANGHTFDTWVWVEDGLERLDCACGEQGTVVNNFSKGLDYRLDGTSYHVSGVGACTDVDIVIPHSHKGKLVTAIDQDAFAMCRSIKFVYISNTVNYIGIGAFKYCEALTTVTFEADSQLQVIAQRAFDSCAALESIKIPASVTEIQKEAFVDSGLISATFENVDGWQYSSYALSSMGTSISADDLADTAKAAQYLVNDYVGKWWRN